MKTLLCTIPDGPVKDNDEPLIPRNGGKHFVPFPLGIVRILSYMENYGHTGDIYDINNLRHSDEKLIHHFKKYKPDVVGLSAVFMHSYPHLKRIANLIREILPETWIVVGGNVTSSSHIILEKTETDICVVGDGEKPFIKLLDYIKSNPDRTNINYDKFLEVKGLSYKNQKNELVVTGNADQMSAPEMQYCDYDKYKEGLELFGGDGNLIMDTFDLIKNTSDVEKYFMDNMDEDALNIFEKLKGKRVARIQTSKGCVAKCTFCQRAIKGYRAFEPKFFENQVIKLRDKYNIGLLIVDDENFGSNKAQAYECAKIMKKHKMYWHAEGARVASVNIEDLKYYRDNNMIAVRFGLESGSQKILDIMEKKIKLDDVYQALEACKNSKVRTTTDAFMVGMPGETRQTVIESAEFVGKLRYLLDMDWENSYPNWTIAIPGTPLYEYCQQIGVIGKTINEEEEYLYRTADQLDEHGVLNYLNKTNFDSKEVHFWTYLYRYVGKHSYAKHVAKNSKSFFDKIKRIYSHCIKFSYDVLVYDYNRRKRSYDKKSFLERVKWYFHILSKFVISASIPIMPKSFLIFIVKFMADIKFKEIQKYKIKNGPQRYNFFINPSKTQENVKFQVEEIISTTRSIDWSLRKVVNNNRLKLPEPKTSEEKGMQILATGR